MKLLVSTLALILSVATAQAGAAAPQKADYTLFVEVKVKADSVAAFKEAILSVVAPTRAEHGNLAYVVHQSPDDPTDFMVYEHWESEEDHASHVTGQGFVNYSKLVGPMIETGYPVRKKMIELE